MKKKQQFSVEPIVGVLKQAEVGRSELPGLRFASALFS